MTKKITSLFLALLAIAGSAFAQPSVTQTTLAAAITSDSARTITVASATGITANTTVLKVDAEFMGVTSVSGTTITVRRGWYGSRATTHGNGSNVHIGPQHAFASRGDLWGPEYSAGPVFPTITPATVTTATAVTLTSGQVRGGLVLQDPNGGAVTTTLPTAALLVAACPGVMEGQAFYFTIRNTADAAETITVAAGTGGTTSGTMTIAQNNSKTFLVRFTAVDSGNEAYTVYSIGTWVH